MKKPKHRRQRVVLDSIFGPKNILSTRTQLTITICVWYLVIGISPLLACYFTSTNVFFIDWFVLQAAAIPLGLLPLLTPVRKAFHELVRGPARSGRKVRQTLSLVGLVRFADWWGLDLRKRIKALAGDYDAEIRRLCREDRYLTARWNKVLAWTFAFWYIGRGPWDWIRALLLLAVKGK